MPKSKQHLCIDCDIEFRVTHEVEAETVKVLFCPFCGLEITPEEEYEIDEDES